MPRAPVIETIKDKRVLTYGDMTLELYLVRGNLHSEGLLMAYVPKEKLLIQADTFIPRPAVPPPPAARPATRNLVENVAPWKLDVNGDAQYHDRTGALGAYLISRRRDG